MTNHDALPVIEDPKRKEFFVKNLNEGIVENLDECLEFLKRGEINRSYAATKMNHQSSRSHALYRLSVQSMPKTGSVAGSVSGPREAGSTFSTQAVLVSKR